MILDYSIRQLLRVFVNIRDVKYEDWSWLMETRLSVLNVFNVSGWRCLGRGVLLSHELWPVSPSLGQVLYFWW